jgi:hypothetical protein
LNNNCSLLYSNCGIYNEFTVANLLLAAATKRSLLEVISSSIFCTCTASSCNLIPGPSLLAKDNFKVPVNEVVISGDVPSVGAVGGAKSYESD